MSWLDGITDSCPPNGHEFEQALGDGEGQGSLVCCSPWGRKELNMTERLNNSLYLGIYVQRGHTPATLPRAHLSPASVGQQIQMKQEQRNDLSI